MIVDTNSPCNAAHVVRAVISEFHSALLPADEI